MRKRTIISLLVVFMMLFSSFFVNVSANSDGQNTQVDNPTESTVFAGGTGTEDDPYLIENADQLSEVRNHLDSNFKLIADIDLAGIDFKPIGDSGDKFTPFHVPNDTVFFTGLLDGNNHQISNFTLKTSNTNRESYNGGFFTYMKNASICNLTLKDINYNVTVLKSGDACLGGVALYAENCTFDNISISGKIQTLAPFTPQGGLCSYIRGGTFKNIVSNVQFTRNGGGGIIGWAYDGASFINCTNNGNINDGRAGIVANANYEGEPNSAEYIFENCHNHGNITSDSMAAGIMCSGNDPSPKIKMNNCSNTGAITSKGTKDMDYRSFASGLVCTGEVGIGGGTVSNCFNSGTIISDIGSAGLLSNSGLTVDNCYNTGNVKCTSKTIDSTASGIAPSIGKIEDSYNTGTIDGTNSAGIVDYFNHDIISRCYNSGSIINTSGRKGVSGGIVAENYSEIVNCYNNGSIQNYNCGGIAGYSKDYAIIDMCYNIGAINNTISGGIAGENKSFSVIDKCYNTGAVSATNLGAAICGVNDSTVGDNYYFDGTTQSVAKAGSGSTNDSVSLSNGQLTNQESYPALDFGTKDTLSKKTAKAAGIWEMSEYSKMPKLTGMKEVYVKSIALSSYPKTYTVNKSIPKSKVKIKVTYSNGKKATINAGFKFKTYSKKIGKRKITVYYAGKSLSFYTTFVPAQVSKVVLKPGKKKVTIKIKKAAGAKKYQIYRSTKSKKGYKLIKTVASTKYVNKKLKSKKIYYFKVRAINGKYKGPFSKIYKVKIK